MPAALRTATVTAFAAVPGLVHGFEQRFAGRESREGTRRRVAAALAPFGRLLLMKQVHGATVVAAPWDGAPEADGAWAEAPGLLLGIETADCLPVLILDPGRRAVAAVHAGWRGTAAGVVARALDFLRARGTDPEEVVAALGPAIGPCCYEVGSELRTAFGPEGERFFRPGPRGRPHLDVRAANVRQLEACGVRAENIHHVNECTACRPERYHSYRRDGPGVGRMISYIGWSQSER